MTQFKNWLSREMADAVIKVHLAVVPLDQAKALAELATLRRVAEQTNRS